MSQRRLTALDLFAGAGGMSCGLSKAGFDVLAAVELDADAAASYRANHPESRVYEKDIRTLRPATVLREIGLTKGELDLLAGCPPCQGFTRLTEKNGKRDPRNGLIRDYLRFVTGARPRFCVFENVPGLQARGKTMFQELRSGLRRLGYAVDFRVVDMVDYGVPQFRRRLVLLASRDTEVSIPPSTHGDERANPWRTVKDALAVFPTAPLRSMVKAGLAQAPMPWHFARDQSVIVERRLSHALKSKGRATLPADLQLECHKGKFDGYYDVYGAMSWDEPSPTMTSGCTNASKGRFGHPSEARPLTAAEAAALQTFPADYVFKGSGVESVARQVGNAVPVEFARVLGMAVRAASIAGGSE